MMPGQALVTVAIGPQKSSGFVLKKIMNIPPPNILQDQDDGENNNPDKMRMKCINRSFKRVFVRLVVHLASPLELRADWSIRRTESPCRILQSTLKYRGILIQKLLTNMMEYVQKSLTCTSSSLIWCVYSVNT